MAVLHFPKPAQGKDRQEAKTEARASTEFHVMFQMREPSEQPWGDVFRGTYSLPAILEIIAAFEKNGVRLRVLFLDEILDDLNKDVIEAAFAKAGRDGQEYWLPAFAVCPMMFAASKGLDRAAGALLEASHFRCDPDQVVNGKISAMGYAVMCERNYFASPSRFSVPSAHWLKVSESAFRQRMLSTTRLQWVRN